MSRLLVFRNCQRVCSVDVRLLRRITRELLENLLRVVRYELGVHLVAAPEMRRLNELFLGHAGSTDVITFDHSEAGCGVSRSSGGCLPDRRERKRQTIAVLHGEMFICLEAARAQARQFRTTWQSELARYVVHGLLHLRGYDDRTAAARRTLKRAENRLLRELSRRFPLRQLARPQP